VLGIGENASGEKQRHARLARRIERDVEALLGADPSHSESEVALGMPRRERRDGDAVRDVRQQRRSGRAAARPIRSSPLTESSC